ncbi:malto-oligosyltrehalose synthase [Microlunatus soli]|uniref:Maltooligosyl trehalose synthase n=1 Tax=Microlunatus soli TaxID=630515 RepID=A0A1H1WJX9_9ACTN|nr:malto-oligosyltrehalose synthase [Microlunatus soli]SDS97453.1 maltooligosyl trehalose synthase [Microlunatus soli]
MTRIAGNTAPRSTYRLQIRPDFTLDDATALLDYLVELGVDAVYLSPLLTSTVGSDHGYDVTDPTRIDPQRGGEPGLRRFLAAATAADLGVVVDIVPNHLGVAVAEQNPAWWDVLTYGRDSVYADWFDIDWSADKLLLPVLGEDPAELGRLRIEDGLLCYWEHRFPIAPGTDGGTAREVHDRQHYRLGSFRLAGTELGYRRFFAVNTLAAVRVEDRSVFDATHTRIRQLVADGVIGLRVDHPDGLADPGGYLDRLRALAPDSWIVVEKILEPGEELPDWPVAGSTGYDALNEIAAVFVEPSAEQPMTEVYRRLSGDRRTEDDHVREGKTQALADLFGSELRRIAALAPAQPGAAELIAAAAVRLDVYRAYLPGDARRITTVLDQLRAERPELAATADALQPRLTDAEDELAVRFGQLTGAVMAKGVEDTAFYRYNRLISSNEVGGDPGRFGMSVEDFHAAAGRRLRDWPATMTTLSTHDTKRSEDVRAAVSVLAELPDRWQAVADRLMHRCPMPDPALAQLLWQTVAAVGPIDRDRLHGYAEKAIREAATISTWLDPDDEAERAVHHALDQVYDDPELAATVAEFRALIGPAAATVAVGQKLIQLTAPGVPDVYQGTEFFDDSLVDPDNRRPVDFVARRKRLAELEHSAGPAADDRDGLKLWVTSRALRARQRLLLDDYRPVLATGPAASHLIAFDRGPLLSIATRLPYTLRSRMLPQVWGDTTVQLPPGRWLDLLTGTTHTATTAVERILDRYPVALLERR